jgi:predicted MPP superfamily phosphohydrolase
MPRWPLPKLLLAIGATLVILGAVAGGTHYYFYARLARDTALAAPWRQLVAWGLVLLAVSVPLSFFLQRALSPGVARVALLPTYLWMGLMFLLLLALGAADGVRALWSALAQWLPAGAAPPADPARRVFLARAVNGGAALAAAAAGGWGHVTARGVAAVKDVRVEVPRLPRALDGTVIAQLSDLHVGPTLGRAWMEDVVRRTNALSPHLVAVTGDLVDGSVEKLRPLVEPLSALRAPWGVYFVTGNHEYYSGVDAWCAELGRMGVRVLRNARASVGPEGGPTFDLAGVDDHEGRGFAGGEGGGPDLARALAGRDASRALVLLAHQPKAIYQASAAGVGLQLSGHTHGGQIWPFRYIVRLTQPYVEGLHLHDGTWVYVSSGTGFWGPPMRLGAPAEITRVTLTAPSSA